MKLYFMSNKLILKGAKFGTLATQSFQLYLYYDPRLISNQLNKGDYQGSHNKYYQQFQQ